MYSIKDEGFSEYLETIIPNIDDAKVQGIAKLFIANGANALSTNQEFVLKEGIADYIMEKCPNCGGSIEFSEMQNTIENGQCNSCQNDWDKNYVDKDE